MFCSYFDRKVEGFSDKIDCTVYVFSSLNALKTFYAFGFSNVRSWANILTLIAEIRGFVPEDQFNTIFYSFWFECNGRVFCRQNFIAAYTVVAFKPGIFFFYVCLHFVLLDHPMKQKVIIHCCILLVLMLYIFFWRNKMRSDLWLKCHHSKSYTWGNLVPYTTSCQ